MFSHILAAALADKIDYYALRGSGSAEPLGIINYSGTNTIAAVGTPDYLDVLNGMQLNMADNAQMRGSLVINPAGWYSLNANLEDSKVNAHVKKPSAVLENITDYVTSQIPAANAVIGDFSKVILGMRQDIMVEVSKDSKFAEHSLQIKATARIDIALSQPAHLCVMSGLS